ncbi:hypothetical protein C1646_819278 [Rhizophagus diaphanus]|nr:hypothetical protein C1646_819278 [Rhizophagus diaphanus] [Rhizophagus sp. MUCL 43196]
MFNLANRYYNGKGIEKNLEKAFHWYQKAAENGYTGAMNNLAYMYYNGEGTEKNLEKTFHWYQKAAENGDEKAMFNLAIFYHEGKGIEKNLEKSFYWYQKAAENGDEKAVFNLAIHCTIGEGTEKNLEKALYCFAETRILDFLGVFSFDSKKRAVPAYGSGPFIDYRGAYTVRYIAGMIRNCGILKVDREIKPDQIDKRIDFAYNIYRDRDMFSHPEGKESEEFKKVFSYPDSKKQIIKFLGLWNTVGAHGLLAYTVGEETWFPDLHCEIGGGTFSTFKGNERITKATILWMIENIELVGSLLMRDDIETYRTRFSPDSGPSWNIKNYIFDRCNNIIPTVMLKDRSIPLELDTHVSNLCVQYDSNTYEELRKAMETKGIKLYNNVKYDKDVNEIAHNDLLNRFFSVKALQH